MKEITRIVAALVALVVVVRDLFVAGHAPAMRAVTLACALAVAGGLSLWREGFLTGSALALLAHYGFALGYGHVALDLAAPLVAGLIVVHLDLLDLAASLPRDRRVDRAFALARLRHAGFVLGAGTAGGAAAFGVAALPWPASEALRTAGLLAVVAAVAVPALLLRPRR
jgi:hypothetical protein